MVLTHFSPAGDVGLLVQLTDISQNHLMELCRDVHDELSRSVHLHSFLVFSGDDVFIARLLTGHWMITDEVLKIFWEVFFSMFPRRQRIISATMGFLHWTSRLWHWVVCRSWCGFHTGKNIVQRPNIVTWQRDQQKKNNWPDFAVADMVLSHRESKQTSFKIKSKLFPTSKWGKKKDDVAGLWCGG